jgi:catechol 2,3-dioxygenase-like lactoylglutathione lyase family enzyme
MPRITQVGRVIIPVSDQDAAIAFYTKTPGFSLIADAPFGKGAVASKSPRRVAARRSPRRRKGTTSRGAGPASRWGRPTRVPTIPN